MNQQESARRAVFPFFMSMVVILLTVTTAFAQSTPDANLNDSEKSAMKQLRCIAEASASLLNVYMDARVTDMLAWSKTCERFREALSGPQPLVDGSEILEEWLKASGAYEAILLLDKNGLCLASAPAGMVKRDFSGEKAFQGAISGKLTVIDVHKSETVASVDPKSNGWTATIAVPVKSGNDLEGTLLSYLKWSRIEKLIFGIRVGESGYVYVLNNQNQVIAHPARHLCGIGLTDPKINLSSLDQAVRKKAPYFAYEFMNAKTGKKDTKFCGFAYPNSYGNFTGLGWTVGAGADMSEVMDIPSFWGVISKMMDFLTEKKAKE